MNIDKQIKSIFYRYSNLVWHRALGQETKKEDLGETEAISQIKQSILKAIMEKIKVRIDELKGLISNQRDMEDVRRNTVRIFELEEFESVIKEILGENK